ncbi:hypothetical protein SAMN02910400_01486 [Lachnospiraceae bacterium C10]|jgi:hypothetical protein|nr:hypothetical protein SAMN02910400_01486 [Lachnospiraceae bacterium C10]SDW68965.1 hypothetical protein SAMN05216391_11469 [Lachnospiraceae bacterium KHCPX20]
MADMNKENLTLAIAKLITETATRIFREEIAKYQKEQSLPDIDPDILTLVKERAISELMFHSSDFKAPFGLADHELREEFDAWFTEDCEEDIRRMCVFNLKSELQKRGQKEEATANFLDRFRKGDVSNFSFKDEEELVKQMKRSEITDDL